MASSRPAWLAGTVAGAIAVGALLTGALLLGGDRRPPRSDHDAAAAAALVAAYERSRTATYLVESEFHRRLRNGRQITVTTTLAQRGTARISFGPTSLDGVLDGYAVGCVRAETGEWQCRRGLAQDLTTVVASEVAALRSLVTGGADRRAYSVSAADRGCFTLRLVRTVLAPPYGREAVLCFDRRSGALARSEIRRAEGRDLTVATRIDVHPADSVFDLPAPVR